MKKLITSLSIFTVLSVSADCIPSYQKEIKELSAEINKIVNGDSKRENSSRGLWYGFLGGSLSYGLGHFSVAAISGTGAGVLALPPAITTGVVITTNSNDEEDASQLHAKLNAVKNGLQLIRESNVKGGKLLLVWQPYAKKSRGDDVSIGELASSISALNEKSIFCESEDLDVVNIIVDKAVENL